MLWYLVTACAAFALGLLLGVACIAFAEKKVNKECAKAGIIKLCGKMYLLQEINEK